MASSRSSEQAVEAAPDRDDWAGHAFERVAVAGHRSGGARRAVIEALARQECCRSAQEIHDEIRGGDRRVGIASVYRVLDLLAGLGLVQRLDIGSGVSMYEPVLPGGAHHHHLLCTDCGQVMPFEDAGLERAIEATARRSGYRVEGHDVLLRGLCPTCPTG